MDISRVRPTNPSLTPSSANSDRVTEQNREVVKNANTSARSHSDQGRDQLDEITDKKIKEVEEGVETLNQSVEALHKGLKFKLHEGSDRMQVQVVDTIKDEILKELPPEEILDMLGRIQEMVGLIIDERV